MIYRKIAIILMMILVILMGCGNSDNGDVVKNQDIVEPSKNIAELYRKFYESASSKGTIGIDTVKEIVQCLGENGYIAIDSENQIDMVNSNLVMEFVSKVENKEASEITIICVMYNGGFIRYDLQSQEGKVEVARSTLVWKGNTPEIDYREEYTAHTWKYAEEGYLFFEQYRMEGFDGPSGHSAIRIQPLDETCRELNRKYIMPVGYDLNNLLTSDWTEEEYGALNFYDLYEPLYNMKKNQLMHHNMLEEGITYDIPKIDFETVYKEYFQIDSEILQQKVIYNESEQTYQYRTRGMFDIANTPHIPYPEVVAYEENENGIIKLTVNAVWPEKNLGKAFSHEVFIRMNDTGGFQYVSNYIIPSIENMEVTWYTERLSEQEWQEYYG